MSHPQTITPTPTMDLAAVEEFNLGDINNSFNIKVEEAQANIKMRKRLLDDVLALTKTINIGVLSLVFIIFVTDTVGVFILKDTYSRIVTENVIITLIGGTVAQIATILIGINRNLFPKNNE